MASNSINTTRKFITVAPDVQLYTERRTLSTTISPKETILFVHGLGGSLNFFYPLFAPILVARPESTLLAYDSSGSGSSPYPASSRPTPTFNDLVRDLDKVIELEASEGPVSIVAHSAGTFIVSRWLTTTSYPSAARVVSVVLIGGPLPSLPPAVADMQRGMASRVLADGVHSIEEMLTPAVLGPTTMRERPLAVALMRSILLANTKEGYAASIVAVSGLAESGEFEWENLGKSVRVLFLGGREDGFAPVSVLEDVRGRVPGSELVFLDAVGHSPTLEAPEETSRIVIEFLSRN